VGRGYLVCGREGKEGRDFCGDDGDRNGGLGGLFNNGGGDGRRVLLHAAAGREVVAYGRVLWAVTARRWFGLHGMHARDRAKQHRQQTEDGREILQSLLHSHWLDVARREVDANG
jgi:hypothetical protein